MKNILVVSTAHVPCQNPDFGDVRSIKHDFGWILFLCLDDEYFEEKYPDWMKPLFAYAQINNCTYINLDADAPITEHLPVWDW